MRSLNLGLCADSFLERECLKEDANVFWLFWNDVGMLFEHDLFVWSIISLSLEMSDVLQHDYKMRSY